MISIKFWQFVRLSSGLVSFGSGLVVDQRVNLDLVRRKNDRLVINNLAGRSFFTRSATMGFHASTCNSLLSGTRRNPVFRYAVSPTPSDRHSDTRVASSSLQELQLREEIRKLRAREIKKQLDILNIPTDDIFEKDELVQRLVKARLEIDSNCTLLEPPGSSLFQNPAATTKPTANVAQVPLLFTSANQERRIASVNMDGGITITPDDDYQPFATVEIRVLQENGQDFTLALLLDTACTGIVLSPLIVERYNLPLLNNPVTMMGAGGAMAATGLTQIRSFSLVGDDAGSRFGPLPAAVQDIGALPPGLDGIIGLSFMQQFEAMELDFDKGLVSFYKESPPPITDNTEGLGLIAEGEMRMLGSLGIYAVDVTIGGDGGKPGRGPVSMLVDLGASSTLLSWKGVNDLGLSVNSSQLSRIYTPTGAMGSDQAVVELTHRLYVSSRLHLGSKSNRTKGLVLSKRSRRLSIDVGHIPVLERLTAEGVGGILGIDTLMRCRRLRLTLKGQRRLLQLMDYDDA